MSQVSWGESWLCSPLVMQRRVFPPHPTQPPLMTSNDMPRTGQLAGLWDLARKGALPAAATSLLITGDWEPGTLIFMLFLSSFLCFSLLALKISFCYFSCQFTHPASFFSHLLFPLCSFSPFHLCPFLSFYFVLPVLIYFSFSFLLLPVASRRGFLNSLPFSAFSTKSIFLLFSLFNILPVYVFCRGFYHTSC